MKLKRATASRLAGVLALMLVVAGCGTAATTSAANQTIPVLVDYHQDQVALSAFDYFPHKVQARPGDTIEFKQAWTGEPHSVTMGTLVDTKMAPIIKLLNKVSATGKLPEGDGEPEEFQQFDLPYTFGDGPNLNQNAAQPCFVEQSAFKGKYPGNPKAPCKKRSQPAFNGQPIYSSGIIPFQGVGGNTFKVKLAPTLKPGVYSYYCNVHGPLQWGQLDVKPKGTEIPSTSAVAKQGRADAAKWSELFVNTYEDAKAGKTLLSGEPGQETKLVTKGKNLVGVPTPFFKGHTFYHGVLNEFAPRTVKAKVGKPVTWTFVGGHTLSFNVPRYFPVFTIAKNGKVTVNKKVNESIGWPDPPGGDEHGDGPPPPPSDVKVDWDGKGFHSAGMGYGDLDTLTITFKKQGTYSYACLLHPQMVGKVVVS